MLARILLSILAEMIRIKLQHVFIWKNNPALDFVKNKGKANPCLVAPNSPKHTYIQVYLDSKQEKLRLQNTLGLFSNIFYSCVFSAYTTDNC